MSTTLRSTADDDNVVETEKEEVDVAVVAVATVTAAADGGCRDKLDNGQVRVAGRQLPHDTCTKKMQSVVDQFV